ncbi:MAG: FtsX-like permease family protein [Rhodanobacter sp.]
MQIKPILSALRRHKAGTLLIMLQIALTLAIVSNAFFIIQQNLTQLSRPTGIDEAQIVRINNQFATGTEATDAALMQSDLDTLRRVPGVVDAYATNSLPLSRSGRSMGINLKPGQPNAMVTAAFYFADEHTIPTLGLQLLAGRNFSPSEIVDQTDNDAFKVPSVIITQSLADTQFPHGSALGKVLYIGSAASTVVGIVRRLEVPWVDAAGAGVHDGDSVLMAARSISNRASYVLRVRPGQLEAVKTAAPNALFASNRVRVIPDDKGVQSFSEIRAEAYASVRGTAVLMGIISLVLLGVTAAGIVGLSSFWVGQRRRQIGIRRALGATSHDILSYFLTENFLISLAGVALGTLLALGMNAWMMQHFEMHRLSPLYVAIGVIVLLLLGQSAVLAPALRASRVPPVTATRTV